jgi:hypothetical protein
MAASRTATAGSRPLLRVALTRPWPSAHPLRAPDRLDDVVAQAAQQRQGHVPPAARDQKLSGARPANDAAGVAAGVEAGHGHLADLNSQTC